MEARLADALVQCFAGVFQGLADLEKPTVRANAAAAAEAAVREVKGSHAFVWWGCTCLRERLFVLSATISNTCAVRQTNVDAHEVALIPRALGAFP